MAKQAYRTEAQVNGQIDAKLAAFGPGDGTGMGPRGYTGDKGEPGKDGLHSIKPGEGISVDTTDPLSPKVSIIPIPKDQTKVITFTTDDLGVADISEATDEMVTAYIMSLDITEQEEFDYIYELVESEVNFDMTAIWRYSYPGVKDEATFRSFLESWVELTDVEISKFKMEGDRITCNLKATSIDGYLYFHNMHMTRLDKLGDITGATHLDLEYNILKEFDPVTPLPSSINSLYLNNNDLIKFDPTLPLPNLWNLALQKNQLIEFNTTLPLPSNLIWVNLYCNQLRSFNPTHPLPGNLETMFLSFNKIDTFNPDHPLPLSLTTFSLYSNLMSTEDFIKSEEWANAQPSFTSTCEFYINFNVSSAVGTNLATILGSKNTNLILS